MTDHVSDQTHLPSVPSIDRGSHESHAIGLGQMNLRLPGADASGSEEGLDYQRLYFASVPVRRPDGVQTR